MFVEMNAVIYVNKQMRFVAVIVCEITRTLYANDGTFSVYHHSNRNIEYCGLPVSPTESLIQENITFLKN